MKRDIELDGIKYFLSEYNFGVETEINDRSIGVEVDTVTKSVAPVSKPGTMRFLSVLHSLDSWTYRGRDGDGELVADESVKILEINEDSLKTIPKSHGDKLANIAGDLNNIGEPEGKNSET